MPESLTTANDFVRGEVTVANLPVSRSAQHIYGSGVSPSTWRPNSGSAAVSRTSDEAASRLPPSHLFENAPAISLPLSTPTSRRTISEED